MASLLVRNVPESVKDRLKRRAKKHGHSMEEEVRDILRRAAREPESPPPPNQQQTPGDGLGTQIANLFRGIGLDRPIKEFRGFTIKPPRFD